MTDKYELITAGKQMKNAYTIKELTTMLNISRATFWRKRKQGVIPEPDINVGHPRWFKATIDAALPRLTTTP